jgi:hypothetical protein
MELSEEEITDSKDLTEEDSVETEKEIILNSKMDGKFIK